MDFLIVGWLIAMTILQLLGRIAENILTAVLRLPENPRITRRRDRQKLDQEHLAATGTPPAAQAITGWFANRVTNPPDRRAMRAFRAWVVTVIADEWEDALTSHQHYRERRKVKKEHAQEEWKRAEQERVERQRAAWEQAAEERRRAAAEPQPDGSDADKVVVWSLCLGGCGGFVSPPHVRCDEVGGECAGPPSETDAPAGDATDSGWVETTPGARTEQGDARRPGQDGPAVYRQWVQAHPRGCGALLATCTSWAHDNGRQRWIITETAWRWLDPAGQVLFDDATRSNSAMVGPAGEPWPAEDDIRAALSGAQPAAPVDTPLLAIVGAVPCPGPCRTWTVDELCPACAQPPARPADAPIAPPDSDPTPEPTPEPNPDPNLIRKAAMSLPALPAGAAGATGAAGAGRPGSGDTADPRVVLAYAQRNVDDNARCQRELELMMRRLTAFRVGDDSIRLVADVWQPGNDFAVLGAAAVTTTARHVVTTATLAANPALSKTVHDTYLSAERAGTLTLPPSDAAAAVNGDVSSPRQAAAAMQAVMKMRSLMIEGLAKVHDTLVAERVTGELLVLITAQREAAANSFFAAQDAAAEFARQMNDTADFWEKNPDLVDINDGRWMDVAAGR